jgi:nucleoside-diphosphate-sugar epimerase
VIVALTGGKGFVGRRLAALHLQAGDTVRVLSRGRAGKSAEGIEVHSGDLGSRDPDVTRFAAGADVIYHCAAELFDESRMQRVNIDGTRALIHAAAGRVGRFVYLSSVGVYSQPRKGAIGEDTVLSPHNEYERSKADGLVREAGTRLPWVILRPSKIIGVGTHDVALYQLMSLMRRGLFFHVGAPGASANYIAVENVAAALMLCGWHAMAPGQTSNLSDWRSYEAFFDSLADALGSRRSRLHLPESLARSIAVPPFQPLTRARIDGLTSRCRYPIARIEKMLAYSHKVSMEQCLTTMATAWKNEAA